MTDPSRPSGADDDPVTLRPPGGATPPPSPEPGDDSHRGEGLGWRLVWIVLIAIMLQVAMTVLWVVTVVQFVLMLTNRGRPNDRLAEFGTGLGIWIAKSVRYLTAASETRPWPWSDID
jgi:hypothetical protein